MKPHLSPTQLEMFVRCGMQYQYRYMEGIKKAPGIGAIRGRGVHTAVQADLTEKLAVKHLLPDEKVEELVRDATNAAWEEGVLLTDDERALGEKKLRGETVDSAVTLAGLHHKQVAPVLDPTHIERTVRVEADNYPYDLMGIIDLQEPGRVRDLKTSSKTPPKTAADSSLQLTFYSLAAKVADGEAPKAVYLDYLVALKTPKYVELPSTRGPHEWNALLRRIEHIANAIQSGVFVPTSPDSWCCSPRYCGYWDICPFGAKGRTRRS